MVLIQLPKYHSIQFHLPSGIPISMKTFFEFNFSLTVALSISIYRLDQSHRFTFVNGSQSVKWKTMPKIFNSMSMFKSFHERCKFRCGSFIMRDRRMMRPCGYPLFMYGGSTIVTVSSSMKYINLILRIRSYCSKFGSITF